MAKVGPHGLQGLLTLTIHRGQNIKDVQLIGKMDPYCKVHLAKEHFKTKVHNDGGSNPVWNQSFIFNLEAKSHDQDMIHFEIRNHNLAKDDDIGRADVKITELVKTLDAKHFITIVDDNNFTKHVGEIEITVEFKGTGLENLPKPVVQQAQQPVVQQQPQQPIVQQQPIQQVQQQQPVQQQYQQPIQQQQPMMQPVMQPQYQSQQPVMMQQPMMGQQPMMYGSQQPVMMGQPMMGQPMMGQPMMYGSQQPVMMVQPMMAQPMNMGFQDGQEVMDPRHPHPLRHLTSVYQGTYTCNGCGQSGTGRVWHCGLCDFDLHPMCVQKLY